MPGTLADQLGNELSLLVFLRHFGCMFCRETISELRDASESLTDYPSVLFFFNDSPMAGKAFLRQYWPTARAVADEDRTFYKGFGVERGGPLKMFGPRVFAAGRRARGKGHENGSLDGNPFQMPGLFLVRGAEVIWRHAFKHAGDHPDWRALPIPR